VLAIWLSAMHQHYVQTIWLSAMHQHIAHAV
jgi:hypothetical protein